MKSGTLYLIPATLGDTPVERVIPREVIEKINTVHFFAAEKIKTARRFLKKVDKDRNISESDFKELNKRSTDDERIEIIRVLLAGTDVGLISEAGMPAVADPGSDLVKMAHENKIRVVPLQGPSSILLALSASGLQGQSFVFHGYLPREERERKQKLIQIERACRQSGETQLFIETPYRNVQMIEAVKNTCLPDTLFCTAMDLTCEGETIITAPVSDWKKINTSKFHKKPAVFLLGM